VLGNTRKGEVTMTIKNDKDRFAWITIKDILGAVERAQYWYRGWQSAQEQIKRLECLLYECNETGGIESVPYQVDHDERRLWPDKSAEIPTD